MFVGGGQHYWAGLGNWRFLLICKVVANETGRVPLESTGTVLRCDTTFLGVIQEVQAQAVSDRALVPSLDCIIGVKLSGMQVDPHLAFLGSPRGNVFLLEGRKSAALWRRNSHTGGLVGQNCEEGSVRTQARLRFWVKIMAGTLCRAKSKSHASEVRARIRRRLRLKFLFRMAPS